MPMKHVVKYGIAGPAKGLRRLAVPLCITLVALVAACPAAYAQLPNLLPPVKLPVKDGAVGDLLPGDAAQDIVDDVVNEPLPGPVEDVVESSPVAPVRDEVRRVVKETTGTVGGGSGGSGGGDSGSGAGGSGSSTGGNTGTDAGSGTPNGGSGTSTTGQQGRGREGSRTKRQNRARRGTQRPRGATRSKAPPGGKERDPQSAPSAAVRRIETIVKAVPTAIWIALGVLSLLALALAGRTFVERRRARALASDREHLMKDMAVLERALLPALPERIGAVAISVAYRSSNGPAAGGDFYDAFELSGGRAAVIVGDVSGHGPDALEATTSMRAQLHALLETGMTPRAAIALLGERAPLQLAGRFSTVVVAVHDPADGTLTYATAGHAPPVIIGPAAEELLSVGASPPIAVGLRTGVRQTTVALPPGSTCCFYTDGMVEAKKGEGMIGRDRFAEMVDWLGPDEQADALLEWVLTEADVASDDMTVCVLRPVSGAQARSPRVEVLELDPDDVDSGFAARFLEACGVPEGELAPIVSQARNLLSSNGLVLLEVTVADGLGRARVTPVDASTPATAA
jgi:hypothetical protein